MLSRETDLYIRAISNLPDIYVPRVHTTLLIHLVELYELGDVIWIFESAYAKFLYRPAKKVVIIIVFKIASSILRDPKLRSALRSIFLYTDLPSLLNGRIQVWVKKSFSLILDFNEGKFLNLQHGVNSQCELMDSRLTHSYVVLKTID